MNTSEVRTRHSATERRERVALEIKAGKSNHAIARKLSVDEGTVRRDRIFLSTPEDERPVRVPRPKKQRPVAEPSPD
jgi:transposase-like protein